MPTSNRVKFSNPELLNQIRGDLLRAWLWPRRDYFASRGLTIPAPGSAEPLCCTALAGILLDPHSDTPPELLESLCMFRDLDNDEAMDAILASARRDNIDLALGPDATPLDVIVRAHTLDPRIVKILYNRLDLRRPRSFQCFAPDLTSVPAFQGATADQLARLEDRLSQYFESTRRGRGARVTTTQQGETFLFNVLHGAPFRREGAMKDGQPTSVFFRRQRQDVVKYDSLHGLMAINCCSDSERIVLLRIFGSVLFGRADFFRGAAQYSLAPLLRHGRDSLACGDVPGLQWVRLVDLHLHLSARFDSREIHKSKDVFTSIEAFNSRWPESPEKLLRATFAVKFFDSPKPRKFTIVPDNKVIYGRPEDSRLLEQFMRQRGFIQTEEKSITE